jgi:hypothetical protein
MVSEHLTSNISSSLVWVHVHRAHSSYGTWDILPSLLNCNSGGYKWVSRVTRKANGSVDRFKACLVSLGYNQRPWLDYKETSSPVVKPATIRDVLTIAVMNWWRLRKIDAHNTFLIHELTEEVYKLQPPCFKDVSRPNHVCRLWKVIFPGLVYSSQNCNSTTWFLESQGKSITIHLRPRLHHLFLTGLHWWSCHYKQSFNIC